MIRGVDGIHARGSAKGGPKGEEGKVKGSRRKGKD
jgi:hypothetical protein